MYGLPKSNFAPYPESYFKTNFYDKSFININLSVYNGLQSMIELAYMGRKTIANFHRHFECVINYKDDDHILELIEKESKKIGTIQPSINVHTANDDWLNVDWWKQ